MSLVVRRTATAAVVMSVLLTLTACSKGSGERGSAGAGVTATVATEPPQTTTTNPYAVPAVIDVAYVNRVLAGLDSTVGDVTRIVIHDRTIPREAYDRLKAIYSDPEFLQLQINNYQADLRKNFAGYRPDPGNKATAVTQLITTRSTCIFARVQRDYSAVATTATSTFSTVWIALKPLDASRDPSNYNRTGWAYIYDGFPPDRSQPPDPCVA